MVCSLHSVTTGSRDRANVPLIINKTPLFSDPRFLYSKILPVTKMRLNVCFNEMALFGPFAALVVVVVVIPYAVCVGMYLSIH